MAIKSPQPPPAAAAALRAGLGQMRGVPEVAAAITAADVTSEESVPHASYHLGLDSIEEKKGVAAAEHVGWRYLIPVGPPGHGLAAEVHARGPEEYQFAGLNEGPFVKQMKDMIERMRAQIGNKDYEPRLLRIPALYIAALWLKGSGDDDVFVPLEPSNPELEVHRAYSRKDFEAAVERAAKNMRAAVPPEADRGPHAP